MKIVSYLSESLRSLMIAGREDLSAISTDTRLCLFVQSRSEEVYSCSGFISYNVASPAVATALATALVVPVAEKHATNVFFAVVPFVLSCEHADAECCQCSH